jgi:hypothetical protein
MYATRLPSDVRTSRLAIVSLITVLLATPCLLIPLLDSLNPYVPRPSGKHGIYGSWQGPTIRWLTLLGTTLSFVALVRIYASRGRRIGAGIAWAALLISGLWWILLLLLHRASQSFDFGPR